MKCIDCERCEVVSDKEGFCHKELPKWVRVGYLGHAIADIQDDARSCNTFEPKESPLD